MFSSNSCSPDYSVEKSVLHSVTKVSASVSSWCNNYFLLDTIVNKTFSTIFLFNLPANNNQAAAE